MSSVNVIVNIPKTYHIYTNLDHNGNPSGDYESLPYNELSPQIKNALNNVKIFGKCPEYYKVKILYNIPEIKEYLKSI